MDLTSKILENENLLLPLNKLKFSILNKQLILILSVELFSGNPSFVFFIIFMESFFSLALIEKLLAF